MNPTANNPRLNDLVEVVGKLYPRASVTVARVGKAPTALRLVPFPRYARMVVPASVPAAAGDALSRPSAGDGKHGSAPRELLSFLLSKGLGPALMPYGLAISDETDSIVEHLGAVLVQQVVISLTVGSKRANRKPILNVHSSSGEEIGFAKVGLSPLTDSLVRHEASVLDNLATRGTLTGTAPRRFTLPEKLYSGIWQGHEVLLMSALRPDASQAQQGVPQGTAAAIIGSAPVTYSTIAGSDWLARLQDSLSGLGSASSSPSDGALPELLEQFANAFGDVEMPFGAWHGDFGPWNMAHTSTVPMVWDWERYETGVPAGMDVVHFTAHQALRKVGDMAAARTVLERQAPAPLRRVLALATDVGVPEPRLVKAITLAYLFTIATRFTLDARSPDGESVQELACWHHQVIADLLHRTAPILQHEMGIYDDRK